MTKKKIKIFIIALVLLFFAVAGYILLLSKPQITVTDVKVEALSVYTEPTHPDYIEGRNPIESIEYFIERYREYGDADVQVFLDGEGLPSDNPADYARVTLEFEVTNRSVFDCYCGYILVNDGEDLYEYIFVTDPMVETYKAEKMSTTGGGKWFFYIYTKGKSISEIEAFIRGIEFQFPFNNDILKNSNQYFKIDENVTFSFNGV